MKQRTIFLAGLLVAALAQGSALARVGHDGMVAGSGAAVFPADASFAGVALSSLQFGLGVLAEDSATSGTFHAAIFGMSAAGQLQQITIEGDVNDGLTAGAGSFGGTATVDLGPGGQQMAAVPFTVTVTGGNLQLVLGDVSLPAAALSVGAIAMD